MLKKKTRIMKSDLDWFRFLARVGGRTDEWGNHRKKTQNMTITQPCFCTYCNIVGGPQKKTEYDN